MIQPKILFITHFCHFPLDYKIIITPIVGYRVMSNQITITVEYQRNSSTKIIITVKWFQHGITACLFFNLTQNEKTAVPLCYEEYNYIDLKQIFGGMNYHFM